VPGPYEVHETTFRWRIEGCCGRQSIQGTFRAVFRRRYRSIRLRVAPGPAGMQRRAKNPNGSWKRSWMQLARQINDPR